MDRDFVSARLGAVARGVEVNAVPAAPRERHRVADGRRVAFVTRGPPRDVHVGARRAEEEQAQSEEARHAGCARECHVDRSLIYFL